MVNLPSKHSRSVRPNSTPVCLRNKGIQKCSQRCSHSLMVNLPSHSHITTLSLTKTRFIVISVGPESCISLFPPFPPSPALIACTSQRSGISLSNTNRPPGRTLSLASRDARSIQSAEDRQPCSAPDECTHVCPVVYLRPNWSDAWHHTISISCENVSLAESARSEEFRPMFYPFSCAAESRRRLNDLCRRFLWQGVKCTSSSAAWLPSFAPVKHSPLCHVHLVSMSPKAEGIDLLPKASGPPGAHSSPSNRVQKRSRCRDDFRTSSTLLDCPTLRVAGYMLCKLDRTPRKSQAPLAPQHARKSEPGHGDREDKPPVPPSRNAEAGRILSLSSSRLACEALPAPPANREGKTPISFQGQAFRRARDHFVQIATRSLSSHHNPICTLQSCSPIHLDDRRGSQTQIDWTTRVFQSAQSLHVSRYACSSSQNDRQASSFNLPCSSAKFIRGIARTASAEPRETGVAPTSLLPSANPVACAKTCSASSSREHCRLGTAVSEYSSASSRARTRSCCHAPVGFGHCATASCTNAQYRPGSRHHTGATESKPWTSSWNRPSSYAYACLGRHTG